MIDNYSREGTLIVCNNFDSGYDSDQALAKVYLEIGKTYTVEKTNIRPSGPVVYLKEVPNIGFNSNFFIHKV